MIYEWHVAAYKSGNPLIKCICFCFSTFKIALYLFDVFTIFIQLIISTLAPSCEHVHLQFLPSLKEFFLANVAEFFQMGKREVSLI